MENNSTFDIPEGAVLTLEYATSDGRKVKFTAELDEAEFMVFYREANYEALWPDMLVYGWDAPKSFAVRWKRPVDKSYAYKIEVEDE